MRSDQLVRVRLAAATVERLVILLGFFRLKLEVAKSVLAAKEGDYHRYHGADGCTKVSWKKDVTRNSKGTFKVFKFKYLRL